MRTPQSDQLDKLRHSVIIVAALRSKHGSPTVTGAPSMSTMKLIVVAADENAEVAAGNRLANLLRFRQVCGRASIAKAIDEAF